MGKRNVELGADKLFANSLSKLPLKRRFQVSLRMSASLPRLRRAVYVPAASEEGGDSSDDMEIAPHRRVSTTTELSSGSDTEASDRDEKNVASGYLADGEMEPRRRRVSRIQPRRKAKAGIVYR